MTINVLTRACLTLLVATALYATVGASAAATYQTSPDTQKTNYTRFEFQDVRVSEQTTATSMIADALVVRPLSLAATVAGTGLFILSLPFSILGNNVDAAARNLVVEPAQYTFQRPLGKFPNDANTGLP